MKHNLEKYLDDAGETRTGFAARVGISRQTVYRIVNHEGEFTTALIRRVCEATGGKVRPSDFFKDLP